MRNDEIMTGLRQIINKLTYLNKNKMEKLLAGFTASEVHCIEYIGLNEDTNVTALANDCFMTNGAISKLTKKLIAKGIIESYKKPENKKEIYFKLTDDGLKIYNLHKNLHDEYNKRDESIFNELTEEDYKSIMKFINNYNEHLDNEINSSNL